MKSGQYSLITLKLQTKPFHYKKSHQLTIITNCLTIIINWHILWIIYYYYNKNKCLAWLHIATYENQSWVLGAENEFKYSDFFKYHDPITNF